jgi:hypothetical protein
MRRMKIRYYQNIEVGVGLDLPCNVKCFILSSANIQPMDRWLLSCVLVNMDLYGI